MHSNFNKIKHNVTNWRKILVPVRHTFRWEADVDSTAFVHDRADEATFCSDDRVVELVGDLNLHLHIVSLQTTAQY